MEAELGEAVYHCMSRTVNGEFLFEEADRELLRKQIWLLAEFCGLQVVTYVILSNHFHILVRVPQRTPVSDEELLRRYERVYPRPTKYQTDRLEVIRKGLASNSEEAVAWRTRQLRLMGDVSVYMKLVKQRFSIGFNRRHQRFGTLWAERFKSVLVEPGPALQTIAAYIDLNAVRAGLVNDPKDYRFGAYAEAIAGQKPAREGYTWLYLQSWHEAGPRHRQAIFGIAVQPNGSRRSLPAETFEKVIRQKGQLSLAETLRQRVRFFADGGVLGSKTFVQDVARQLGRIRVKEGREVLSGVFEQGLFVLRGRQMTG